MSQAERRTIMERIYESLKKWGYRPMDQLIGYILTGDPTYITNHSNTRQLAADVDRYDLLQDMLLAYLANGEIAERSA